MIPSSKRVEGWNARLPESPLLARADAQLSLLFAEPDRSALNRYKLLFDYLLAGFLEFRTPAGERAYYPGFKGMRGHRIEGLEGFARTVPLFASWLASGRGEQAFLVELTRTAAGWRLVQVHREASGPAAR